MILPLKMHAEFSNYISREVLAGKKKKLHFQINLVSLAIRFVASFVRIILAFGKKSWLFISGK